jgi:predicted DNA-binding ribbon-helix-helix protein
MLKSLFSPSSAYKKDTSLGTSSLKIRAAVSSERLVSFYWIIPCLIPENSKISHRNLIENIKAEISLHTS